MLRRCIISVLSLLAAATVGDGFSASQMRARRFGAPLPYSFHDHEGDSPQLRARTCPRNLLTQRAVQSLIFLLLNCRDPHTAQWLQSTLNVENMEHFHGTGLFNLTTFPTWDSTLKRLLTKPKTTIEITKISRPAGGGGGWRGQIGGWNAPRKEVKKNPNIKEIVQKFSVDIDPASVVSRLISVRERIALECQRDCETLIYANDQILASYFETQESSRQDHDEEDCESQDDDMPMDTLTIPYSERTEHRKHNKSAFDRYNAMVLLSNSMDYADQSSSPLRKGTFDLILLLSTQESIHRVLKDYAAAGEEREVSFAWLRDFYLERVQEYFDGNQRYGRADDFLEELLLTPPMLKTINDKNSRKEMVGLVDPLRVAEDIIRQRGEVGREWQEMIANVPHEHMELRRLLLARQMGEDIEMFVPLEPESTFEISEGFE